jgi:hypothetical protein
MIITFNYELKNLQVCQKSKRDEISEKVYNNQFPVWEGG